MYHMFFIYYSNYGYIGPFHFFSILSSAVINKGWMCLLQTGLLPLFVCLSIYLSYLFDFVIVYHSSQQW